ncbi:MAG TPA: tyrosine--tRNA ligase [Saprospiraceae bacterium]|nr:tyrosine--tRNA ligase [Saprospiraceae bacterium]
MNFIEELTWRGLLKDATPGVEELLNNQMVTGYIGFDPTAPSLTIGNYVPIMLLTLFQRSGHQPVVLMGGATGRIGDPSGRDTERELKSAEELDANLAHQAEQFKKLLNFEDGPNKAIMVNNFDFYQGMSVLDFLRDAGKTLTVNYMLSKDAVKNRMEGGISFTEFSYQLLQAYDFEVLFKKYNCVLQMGGSDQWGNITSGTEFIRRHLGESAYALTAPLLTKKDGTKFGKSAGGNIWLDPAMTSPYRFYQFWLNAEDDNIAKYTRYFTLRSKEEVEAAELEFAGNPNELKRMLAEELTIRIHSQEAYESVKKVSELLFGRNSDRDHLLSLSEAELQTVAEEIPHYKVPRSLFHDGLALADLLTEHTGILPTKSELRRAVQGNSISVNKEKISSHEHQTDASALLHGRFLLVENGKKNKFVVEVERSK